MSEFYILKDRVAVPATSTEEWARQLEQTDRHVGRDDISGVRISTVFLGINHQYGDGPPLLFETMIFGGPHDQWQERCSTWAEAEAMHARACNLVRGGLN